jgi:hypothetical protein
LGISAADVISLSEMELDVELKGHVFAARQQGLGALSVTNCAV